MRRRAPAPPPIVVEPPAAVPLDWDIGRVLARPPHAIRPAEVEVIAGAVEWARRQIVEALCEDYARQVATWLYEVRIDPDRRLGHFFDVLLSAPDGRRFGLRVHGNAELLAADALEITREQAVQYRRTELLAELGADVADRRGPVGYGGLPAELNAQIAVDLARGVDEHIHRHITQGMFVAERVQADGAALPAAGNLTLEDVRRAQRALQAEPGPALTLAQQVEQLYQYGLMTLEQIQQAWWGGFPRWGVQPPPGARPADPDWQRRQAEELARQRRAEVTAYALLNRFLTDQQRLQLAQEGYFVVTGSAGGLYAIRHGTTYNVTRLTKGGEPEYQLCAHPAAVLPCGDVMLAQKWQLETDELGFLAIANRG